MESIEIKNKPCYNGNESDNAKLAADAIDRIISELTEEEKVQLLIHLFNSGLPLCCCTKTEADAPKKEESSDV